MGNFENLALRGAISEDEHAALRGLLPEYMMISLACAPVPPELSALTTHLATCQECRQELAAIVQMLADTAACTLPPSLDYPPFDLAQLIAESTPNDQPERAIIASKLNGLGVFGQVTRAIQHAVVQFSEETVNSFRRHDLAGAFRGPLSGSYQHMSQRADDIHIAIDVATTDQEHGCCCVVVTVVDPKNPFAQAGHSVTLRYDTQVNQQISDHRGCVAFENIPAEVLPQLQFTIAFYAQLSDDT